MLDLRTADGSARLHGLLDSADVLVHGYRPHALEARGKVIVSHNQATLAPAFWPVYRISSGLLTWAGLVPRSANRGSAAGRCG